VSLTAESAALHARVRRFALASLRVPADVGETFASLAFDIAAFQARHVPVVARLAAGGAAPTELIDLPAVPSDVFRLTRVAAHPEQDDVARFQTSGTTGGAGVHAFRTLDTYRELSVAWGRRALLGARDAVTVLALATPFEPARRSSLGFMMQAFMDAFDPAASPSDQAGLGPRVERPRRRGWGPDALLTRGESIPAGRGSASDPRRRDARWLLSDSGLDLAALERGVAAARDRREPVLLLATSFALVWLLEALGDRRVPLPPGSVVMHTGGFKGKSRELPAPELVRAVCRALALEPAQLIGEYGMTELSSQLYDRGFSLDAEGPGSVFVTPPWLELLVVDPLTFRAVPDGEIGLARFVDLCNIDSALVIQTQDRVRRVPGGIELHGRQPGSVLRGCSLAIEELAEQIRVR
jgi:hypothetical protein